MAQDWIHVGHVAPSTTTETAIGSAVPSGHKWEVKVWIANRTGSAKTYRLRQAYADAAAANDQWRAYDATISANDLVAMPAFHMSATDKLYATASADGLTFVADALDLS